MNKLIEKKWKFWTTSTIKQKAKISWIKINLLLFPFFKK